MESAIYVGSLYHRRFQPKDNAFDYRLFMMYLDLDELPELFEPHPLWSARRPALAWFRRSDHLGPEHEPLDVSVRNLVEARLGKRPAGPVRLLTHLRYFGYGFNPVSFYYCFDAGGSVEAVVAEINNTPWGEQYCYVVEGLRDHSIQKVFHVSPFLEMDQRYRWSFTTPGDELTVHMENHTPDGKIFDATLRMSRQPLTASSLNHKLARFPFMTAAVVARIYWQAARLWWKRCPFVPHPGERAASERLESR